MIFETLAWPIELYMTKYIIGEIFSSGGATLYNNPLIKLWHAVEADGGRIDLKMISFMKKYS